MAKLPQTQTIRLEDLRTDEDLPKWLAIMLRPINNALSFIYNAMNKDITFQDNINCQLKELSFTPEQLPLSFKSSISKHPFGVIMVYFKLANDPSRILTDTHVLDWTANETNVIINNITNTTSTVKYTARFLVF